MIFPSVRGDYEQLEKDGAIEKTVALSGFFIL